MTTHEEYAQTLVRGLRNLVHDGILPWSPVDSFAELGEYIDADNPSFWRGILGAELAGGDWLAVRNRADTILKGYAERRRIDQTAGAFVIDGASGQYPAIRFGARWNGWATPIVTRETFAQLIDDINRDAGAGGPYYALSWYGPTAIFTQLEASGGDQWIDVIPQSNDGLYDLGYLGWCFNRADDFDEGK